MRSLRIRPTRVRLGGTAAVLAGLCYGSAGYLDRPGISGYTSALVFVLSVAIPVLFLGGLLGLHARLLLVAQKSLVGGVGLMLGCLGCVLGIVGALLLAGTPYSQITEWWWVPLLAGLVLMGLSAFLKGGATAFGGRGVDLRGPRMGLLAYRSGLLWRFGAHALGPRRYCGRVLPECRGVGGHTDGDTRGSLTAANFLQRRHRELRRIPLPRTPPNRCKNEEPAAARFTSDICVVRT